MNRIPLTLDFLSLLVAHVLCHLDRVAHERVATRKLHRSLDRVVKLYDVDGETGSSGDLTELVVRRFGLDRLDRNECGNASSLHAHVLVW